MKIEFNGKIVDLPDNMKLMSFLEECKISFEAAVVERNRTILNGYEIKETFLCENDSLEILSFVGGG
jgi:thiamine biosynthesis protein ThiS